VNEAGAALEILVSYDAEGAEVDRLEIGVLTVDGEARKYATVLVNRLSVFELVASKTSEKRQEQMTEYLITPNLSFRKGKTFRKLM
jgi:hypothetical protein